MATKTEEKVTGTIVENRGQRRIVIDEKHVLRALRGVAVAEDNPNPLNRERWLLPGCLVELKNDFAAKLIKGFPREIVKYGVPDLSHAKGQSNLNLNAFEPKKDPNELDSSDS